MALLFSKSKLLLRSSSLLKQGILASFSTQNPTSTLSEDASFLHGKPTLEYAKKMPNNFAMMKHEQIIQLSAEGVPEAIREALIRNIMVVDSADYDTAVFRLDEISKRNREGQEFSVIPYHLGLATAVFAGVLSVPMVFHLGTVEWFNQHFVTADVPEPKDLETWLEVGSWSWAWMEPVIGQASFALLCMQFSRSQLKNMGLRPFSSHSKERRAQRLVRAFPQYEERLVKAYSKSIDYYPQAF